jgi:hypothetical protein
MKIFQLLICVLSLFVLSNALNTAVFAQNNSLPAELTEKSSLAETLKWLDETSFSRARIGLNFVASHDEPELSGYYSSYSEFAVFSQGFKLIKTDGCRITLRNKDVKLLSFSHLYPEGSDASLPSFRKSAGNQMKYSGDLVVSLDKLSYKQVKTPYRHSEKAEEINVFGTWRTRFKRKGGFLIFPAVRTKENLEDIKIEITASEQGGKAESMSSDDLTFTFDDLETSKSFYAAFRQAIKLCRVD